MRSLVLAVAGSPFMILGVERRLYPSLPGEGLEGTKIIEYLRQQNGLMATLANREDLEKDVLRLRIDVFRRYFANLAVVAWRDAENFAAEDPMISYAVEANGVIVIREARLSSAWPDACVGLRYPNRARK